MSRQSITAGKAVIVVELTDKATAQFSKVVGGLAGKMQQVSRVFRDAATNAFGGSLLTGMVSGNVLRNFAKFEDTILNLTVKLGYFGNKTTEQIRNINTLEKEILRLGSSTAYTSQQVGEAAVSLAQAGFAVDEIRGSLQAVIDLARGTSYSLNESADLVANLIRNFNMFGANTSLEERMKITTELSSQLVKATRLGTIEIADLREAFKYAGGTANTLGVDIKELMGYFVQMSEAGLKGSLAGTSMNTMMLNMINNLDKIQEKFPGFNILMKGPKKIDLTGTVEQLVQLSEAMDVTSRTAFFQEIFNIRGARAFSAVLEVDRVKAFTQAIKEAAAESRLAAIEMESGLGGASRRAYNAMDNLRILLGKMVQPEFIALLNLAAGLAQSLQKVVVQNKALVLGLMISPGILAAIGVAALTLSFTLSRLSLVVRGLGTAFKSIGATGRFMAGSVSGTAAMLPKRGPSKRQLIAAQSAKVAKKQASIDAMLSRAMQAKNPTAALAKVGQTKAMSSLIHETLKLQTLKKSSFLSKVGNLPQSLGKKYQALSKPAKAVTKGALAGSALATGNLPLSGKEWHVAVRNMKEGVKNILPLIKSFIPTISGAIKTTASWGNAITTLGKNIVQSKSVQGIKGLIKYGGQVRAGFVTGHIPNITNTKMLTQSIGLLKGSALAKSGIALVNLGVGFGRLAMGLTKFVFSWNFVGMALNALLLFGDKIPAISQAFAALGNGISGFFSQLGRVASYAGPALSLFQLAISAFTQGFSGTGFSALQAAFEGLVAIIRNQLIAAWNEFMYHVEYLIVFFQQIYKSIEIIVRSLFTGLTQALGVLASPVMQAVSTIGTAFSGGGGTMAQLATQIIQGIDMFISWFFKGIITLNDYLMKFLYEFQNVMGEVIQRIPGTGSAGADIQQQARNNQTTYEIGSSMAKAQIEIERKKRSKEIESIMSVNTAAMAEQRRQTVEAANAGSDAWGQRMGDIFHNLSNQLIEQQQARADYIAKLQAEAGGNDPQSRPWDPNASAGMGQQIAESIKAVVGTVDQTRNYLKASKDQSQIQRDQLTELKDINRNLRVNGGLQ